jgi:hypothetical protein
MYEARARTKPAKIRPDPPLTGGGGKAYKARLPCPLHMYTQRSIPEPNFIKFRFFDGDKEIFQTFFCSHCLRTQTQASDSSDVIFFPKSNK